MLMCDETATLVRTDGEEYTQETISGVSWYDKAIATVQDRGLGVARVTKIRIPKENMPEMLPRNGDLMIRGIVDIPITGLKDLEGYTYAKVMEVSDNLRGGMPHVAVVCK